LGADFYAVKDASGGFGDYADYLCAGVFRQAFYFYSRVWGVYGDQVHAACGVVPGYFDFVPGYNELVSGDKYRVGSLGLYVDKLGDVALGVGVAVEYNLYVVTQIA